jgi:hypothetical protein
LPSYLAFQPSRPSPFLPCYCGDAEAFAASIFSRSALIGSSFCF